jgi:hypothetical protein
MRGENSTRDHNSDPESLIIRRPIKMVRSQLLTVMLCGNNIKKKSCKPDKYTGFCWMYRSKNRIQEVRPIGRHPGFDDTNSRDESWYFESLIIRRATKMVRSQLLIDMHCGNAIKTDFCKPDEYACICWMDRSKNRIQEVGPVGRHPGFRWHQFEGRILIF